MSDIVSATRRRIRLLIDDLDPNDAAIDSERLTALMQNRMHLLAQEVGLGPTWSTSAVTLAAGTYQYNLSTAVQYERVMAVQLNSYNWLMERVTPLELQAMRDGVTNVSGAPTHYALHESIAQQVNLWLYPTPYAADFLNVLLAQVPAALSTDATTIPFSTPLLAAMEKAVALDAVLLMDEEERAKRKVVLDVASKWNQEVARAIRLEKVRFGNQRRSDVVPERWA